MKIRLAIMTLIVIFSFSLSGIVDKECEVEYGSLMNIEKIYVTADQFLQDSFSLARKVFDSDYKPTFLIALWRGGASVGLAFTELFDYKKRPFRNHQSIRTSSYHVNQQKTEVEIFGLDCIIQILESGDKILIVDDVVDTGNTIEKVLEEFKEKCGRHCDVDIKVAAVYYKPEISSFKPDFYIHETSQWLVFPHEVTGLEIDAIRGFHGDAIADSLR